MPSIASAVSCGARAAVDRQRLVDRLRAGDGADDQPEQKSSEASRAATAPAASVSRVGPNLIEASWEALTDSAIWGLRNRGVAPR